MELFSSFQSMFYYVLSLFDFIMEIITETRVVHKFTKYEQFISTIIIQTLWLC